MGAAAAGFEHRAAAALGGGHAPLAAQARVGEGVDEVALGPDHQVKVQRVILAIGKALEAIDHHRLPDWS